MKQVIGIPMGIYPALFCVNLSLYSHKQEYMTPIASSAKIKARHFQSIDDLCGINDGGKFGRSISDIYPKEFELKVEHHSDNATLLNLEGTFIYKLFDKETSLPFKMSHIEINIHQNIFIHQPKTSS